MSAPLLELDSVEKRYGALVAVAALNLRIDMDRAPIIAVAGESGSGKTTLASLLLGFAEPTSGEIRYQGKPLRSLAGSAWRSFRREVQAVFQDPFAVYNPFYRVDHALLEPLRLFGIAKSKAEAYRMMEGVCEKVGLHHEDTLGRFPHQLSGGQRQRLMVARALLMQPKLLVADEPVSMIDASLRALVLGNLRALNNELKIPIVYITHDLTTAYHIADVIMVMYRGKVVEAGSAESVIEAPQHPYTQLLVDSIPWPDLDVGWGERQSILKDDDRAATATGCAFAGRCPSVTDACRSAPPPFFSTDSGTAVRCILNETKTPFDDHGLSALLQLAQ